jgi:hypothetical protein
MLKRKTKSTTIFLIQKPEAIASANGNEILFNNGKR